jgi:hypothetical protein
MKGRELSRTALPYVSTVVVVLEQSSLRFFEPRVR